MRMRREFRNLKELIEKRLLLDEYESTSALIDELKEVKRRGYFTRAEFLKMSNWKSPRPRRLYESNSAISLRKISESVFFSADENERIELLTRLKGVSIPVASAILTLTDPENYGVLDIRV